MAINQEGEWYKQFLMNKSQTLDDIDNTFRKMLLERLYNILNKKRVGTITQDISINGLYKIFNYYINRKKYNLNFPLLVFILIEILKDRFVKKSKS